MKYVVTIDARRYEVELGELHTNPITALVDGVPVEVFLESEGGMRPAFTLPAVSYQRPAPVVQVSQPQPPAARRPQPVLDRGAPMPVAVASAETLVRAPIPGVVLSLNVQPGDQVESGQTLCTLEAMKMKNAIRAPRPGVIARLHVAAGQAVQHRDVLLEFEA